MIRSGKGSLKHIMWELDRLLSGLRGVSLISGRSFGMHSHKLKSGRHVNRLAAIMEGLETRQFCDGSFGTAVALGAVSGLVVKLDHVDALANHKDFYKLTTSLPGRLRVTLDSISGGDADLFVYNGSQVLIGSSVADGNAGEIVDK